MKKNVKSFIVGVALTTLVVYQIPSIAESIDVVFNKIKITINGQPVSADNVLINGRTYVPLRAISEILGKDVTFDQATSTAGINDKDYNPDKLKGPGYSRENPADLNTIVKIDFKDGYISGTLEPKKYSANIAVKEILRGDPAWQIIKSENQFNKEAPSDKDYILAKINFELLTSPDQYSLSNSNFILISSEGKEYDAQYISIPKFEINTKLYSGAKHEGYAVFMCDFKDNKPVISFGKDYNGKGGIWFKTY